MKRWKVCIRHICDTQEAQEITLDADAVEIAGDKLVFVNYQFTPPTKRVVAVFSFWEWATEV